MNETIHNLLTIFNQLAPNGRVQQAMALVVRTMHESGADDKRIILCIVRALHDGLEYDNWE